jgi:SAM-dependent methyltransferase
VQSPEAHIEFLERICHELRPNLKTRILREDFCGTHALSTCWIKRDPARRAFGVDLDPEALAWGRARNAKLPLSLRRRLDIREGNVLKKQPQAEVAMAGNFSFYVFKTRELLLQYFRAALAGLSEEGLLVLEMAGGPGMIEATRERKTVKTPRGRKFSYVWDQQSFDPITHDAKYAIHFKFPDGSCLMDAFTYDWRLWSIPEVREALLDAGFSSTAVYWETTHRGEGTGEYTLSERGDNAYAWIAHVVGIKSA